MSKTDYAEAIAEFMRKKGVTKCPTACVVATGASVGEQDRVALRNYDAAREAARLEKMRHFHQVVAAAPVNAPGSVVSAAL